MRPSVDVGMRRHCTDTDGAPQASANVVCFSIRCIRTVCVNQSIVLHALSVLGRLSVRRGSFCGNRLGVRWGSCDGNRLRHGVGLRLELTGGHGLWRGHHTAACGATLHTQGNATDGEHNQTSCDIGSTTWLKEPLKRHVQAVTHTDEGACLVETSVGTHCDSRGARAPAGCIAVDAADVAGAGG